MIVDIRPVRVSGPCFRTPRIFHVGPYEYELIFVNGHILRKGRLRTAWVNFEQQQIIVSVLLTKDQICHAVIHELCHAWEYHFSSTIEPDDSEARCDFFGTIVLQLLKDLDVKMIGMN